MRSKVKIAILGATSHIAKGLIAEFCNRETLELFLFARSPGRVDDFLAFIGCGKAAAVHPFVEFYGEKYDIIVNCVGIGDPGRLSESISSIFKITEEYDNLVLDYLARYPETLYIHISSGAAYGTDFSRPADDSTLARFAINHLGPGDYYGIAKLNSEAKHRALSWLNIVDLRVFGYFSRFIDIETKFFLSEVISCAREGKELLTGPGNITRDYVHPRDLMSLVECCINIGKINDVYDVYSLHPATKFEILDYFSRKHNLRYRVKADFKGETVTGSKDNYYSINRRAKGIGYIPRITSLDSIAEESQVILGNA